MAKSAFKPFLCLAFAGLASAPRTASAAGCAPAVVAMLVADPGALNGSETAIKARLEGFGYTVALVDDSSADETAVVQAAGARWAYISSTILSADLNQSLRDLPLPLWCNEHAFYDELGMTGVGDGWDHAEAGSQTSLDILAPASPLAAGLSGNGVGVLGAASSYAWGRPSASALKVASMPGAAAQAVIFAYPKSSPMSGGFTAPEKRLGFFLTNNTAASLNANGWALFDAALQWIDCTSVATPTPSPTPTPIPAATPQADAFDNASLEAFWRAVDIGSPPPGSQAEASSLSITAGGCDIWDRADAFRFVFQPALGGFDATLRVDTVPATDGWSKVGLMLRAGEGEGAPYAFMAATYANNYTFQYRSGTALAAASAFIGGAFSSGTPGWVRLRREGGSIRGYHSADGAAWVLAGTVSDVYPDPGLLGVAASSHACGTLGSARVDDFVLLPTSTPTPTPLASWSITLRILSASGLELRVVQGLSATHALSAPSLPSGVHDPSKGPLLLKDGDFSYAFDGKDAEGRALPAGVYTMEVSSSQGGAAGIKTLMFELLGPSSAPLSLLASPNPLLARSKELSLVWTPAVEVEIRVYNSSGDLVRLFERASGGRLIWDLKTGSGQTASNGLYLLTVRRPEERIPKVFKAFLAR